MASYCHFNPLGRSIFSACHFMTSTSGRVPSQVPYAPYRLVVYIYIYIDIPPGNWGWHIIFPPFLVFGTFLRMSCLAVFGWDMFSRLYTTYTYECWRSPEPYAPFGRVHTCLQEAYVPPAPQSRPEVWRMRIVDFVHGDRRPQLAAMIYNEIQWYKEDDFQDLRMR